jgi:Zn-dependent protease with chaperone function
MRLQPCIGQALSVHALASQAPSAYSFPDGSIFVTAGLLRLLNEDELTAAIAHELGHLLGDKHDRPLVSLRGCVEDMDAEARADLIGAQLLKVVHVNPAAMSSMLGKIRSSGTLPPSCAHAMEHRIRLLGVQDP